jgi:DNA polymerase-3 subunit gamma/tau
VFILATTEKHKIIPTILSRCQIFDFKRITVSDTKNYLKLIAKEQGVDADEDALNIIAQKSDGAMRDALSIFDRVVSFCGSKLTRKAVSENLSVLDFDIFFETTDLIIKNNIPGLLLILDKVIEKGFDSQHYISGLASHFRDLYVSKNNETLNLLETSLSIRDRYKIQSKEINASFLTEAISLTNDCDLKFRSSRNKRLLVELCLMKLASIGFDGKKKKKTSKYIIPPSNYQNNSELLQKEEVNQDILSVNPINDSNDVTKLDDESNSENKNNEVNNIINYNRQSSGLSLKTIQRKKEHKIKQMEVSVDPKDLPNNPFTQEDLLKYWEEYVKKYSLGILKKKNTHY